MASLAPVPKPAHSGSPQSAIAITRLAYANVRNGPGTQYLDIGDLRKYTLAAYYPASRTADGWVWIEQGGMQGWVSTSVVTFEHVAPPPPPAGTGATPYDGQIGIWHWRGDVIPENSVDDVARNIKMNAPYVSQLWVKTSDYTPRTGAQWQGFWDSKRSLAIDNAASIDRWVSGLAKYGLEFHAWCVPRGGDINAEADLIIQACLRPGVKSMILDVEPFDGYWIGGRDRIRPFMTRIRRALPGAFHIGMAVDPRIQHYESIFPREWAPFVNSIHPMVYWATMQRPLDGLLEETYRVWGGYGKPIVPILQGNAAASDITAAINLATGRHRARGVSWWRLGVIGPVEWNALNRPINTTTAPPPPSTPVVYGEERIIKPDDPGCRRFSHTGRDEFRPFTGAWGWRAYYKATEPQTSKVTVEFSPSLSAAGVYEIAAFVPARHATTRSARFKIHGVRGSTTELLVSVNQEIHFNQWVTLGVFDIDTTKPKAGHVFVNDLTGETGREIAFDAMRWRRVLSVGQQPPTGVPAGFADGYDSPVGTDVERRSSKVWPGQWLDASPFGKLYFVGTPNEAYHTGADLNLPRNADAHMPVYSVASGIVVFANRLPVWGNVIIIKNDPLVSTGMVVYARYAHVEDMRVTVGQRVKRGDMICKIGNAFGRWAYHLHFDLSPTTILETNPSHWPGRDRDELFNHYIDPREFIETHRPR
jgi:murein DD-endopeptidase MepM/ murein hydrolase activator NlpD